MKLIIDIDDEMICNDIKCKALEPTSATDEVIINALYNGIPCEKRPQGKWHGNNFDEHSCPLCGHPALYEEEPDGYYEVQSNFCPNCGADMRGKEAENEAN